MKKWQLWPKNVITQIFQRPYIFISILVDRYLRKLDDELLKFKCELEADNRGITEILEKQSLELDAPPRSRYDFT